MQKLKVYAAKKSERNTPLASFSLEQWTLKLDFLIVKQAIILCMKQASPSAIDASPRHCIFELAVGILVLQHTCRNFLEHNSSALMIQENHFMPVIERSGWTQIFPKMFEWRGTKRHIPTTHLDSPCDPVGKRTLKLLSTTQSTWKVHQLENLGTIVLFLFAHFAHKGRWHMGHQAVSRSDCVGDSSAAGSRNLYIYIYHNLTYSILWPCGLQTWLLFKLFCSNKTLQHPPTMRS